MIRRLFKRIFGKTQGAFVEVMLDYGFGRTEAGRPDDLPSFQIENSRTACLYITDIDAEDAKTKLAGRRFDWHTIHSHWRHYLELEGFHKATWKQVQEYLA
jgi:hypothetical protein